MNYASSNYCYKKFSNFFTSTISPFVLFILWREHLHLGKKGGKRRIRKLFKDKEKKAFLQY